MTERMKMKVNIPWYMKDPRFTAGTVADVGNIRLTLKKTDRMKNNKWRLYMEVRIRKEHGIKDDLKREVAVAEFDGNISLSEAQEKANEYLADFIGSILYSATN